MGLLWQIVEYIRQGGWVMLPLGICSLVLWALIAERLYAYRLLRRGDIPIQAALAALASGRLAPGEGLRARLVRAFLARRTGDPAHDARILEECIEHLRPGLTSSLAVIAVLAAIAPLLGLLGTVIGMITTFDVIAIFGTGNARALAGGISIALITTQSGLLIAIPGLLFSGALERRAAKLEHRLTEVAAVLARHVGEEAS